MIVPGCGFFPFRQADTHDVEDEIDARKRLALDEDRGDTMAILLVYVEDALTPGAQRR